MLMGSAVQVTIDGTTIECLIYHSSHCNSFEDRVHLYIILNHDGLVTPFGDIDLSQHWLVYRLVAYWHLVIIWPSVDSLSERFNGIHLRAISQDTHEPSITRFRMKLTDLNFHTNLPGANELKHLVSQWVSVTWELWEGDQKVTSAMIARWHVLLREWSHSRAFAYRLIGAMWSMPAAIKFACSHQNHLLFINLW